ncbi:hypothetical protein GCM10011409_38670 [Lentibacillus populi]|uniref:Transposase DDE domain-containing protein n=1 Tax=Lentibacillus populi TaxID=1827502 RepID=A0A9W5X7L2_9BACI|nr:hypothetical protein GCM10011409_38670 [Lentibacillus populi]
MATLPQITLDFNRKIKLSNDGGELSSDTGEMIFREFDEKIGFSATLAECLGSSMNGATMCMRMKIYFDKKSIKSSLDTPKMMRQTP